MSKNIMARKKHTPEKEALVNAILEQYQPQSVADMQEALKDIFGPMFEAMLKGEMNSHLGYNSNDHGFKETDNRRNGYISKNVKTTAGQIPISVPRDRDASFAPQLVPKRTRDVSEIEDKVLSMYAKGMSQRDIADSPGFGQVKVAGSMLVTTLPELVMERINIIIKDLVSSG